MFDNLWEYDDGSYMHPYHPSRIQGFAPPVAPTPHPPAASTSPNIDTDAGDDGDVDTNTAIEAEVLDTDLELCSLAELEMNQKNSISNKELLEEAEKIIEKKIDELNKQKNSIQSIDKLIGLEKALSSDTSTHFGFSISGKGIKIDNSIQLDKECRLAIGDVIRDFVRRRVSQVMSIIDENQPITEPTET